MKPFEERISSPCKCFLLQNIEYFKKREEHRLSSKANLHTCKHLEKRDINRPIFRGQCTSPFSRGTVLSFTLSSEEGISTFEGVSLNLHQRQTVLFSFFYLHLPNATMLAASLFFEPTRKGTASNAAFNLRSQ